MPKESSTRVAPVPDVSVVESFSTQSLSNTDVSVVSSKNFFGDFLIIAGEWINNGIAMDYGRQGKICSGFYFFVIAFLVVFPTTTISMVPWHQFPAYSWEGLLMHFPGELAYATVFIFYHHFDFSILMRERTLPSARNLLFLFFSFCSIFVLTKLIVILLKTNELLVIPGDFVPLINATITFTVHYAGVWFQHHNRSDGQFKNSFKWLICTRFTGLLIFVGYAITGNLFSKIPKVYQPALILLFNALKYGNVKLFSYLAKRINSENTSVIKFSVTCSVGCIYSFYMAYIIGSNATLTTVILLCLVDTCLNIKLCFDTIKLIKKQDRHIANEIQRPLQTLALKEVLEILLPACFCIIRCMAYLGPNKDSLSIFEGKEIGDIMLFLIKVGLFMTYDVLRITLISVVLWKSCKVSLFSSYCQLMEIYWKPIAGYAAFILFSVSIENIFIYRIILPNLIS